MDRGNTSTLNERTGGVRGFGRSLARGLAMALALASQTFAAPALAQPRATDAELEALIPDAAVADPQAWATPGQPVAPPVTSPPATTPPAAPLPAEPDPASPLVEDGTFTLPWPQQDEAERPEQAALEPEADLAEAAAQADLPEDTAHPAGQVSRISPRLSLVWPNDLGDFPDRPAFEKRFRELSAIEQLSGKGEGGLAQLAVRARSDNLLLVRLLRINGYYDADVLQSVIGVEPGKDGNADVGDGEASIRFDIAPGVRYRFGAVDLGGLADARADFDGLRASFAIRSGDGISGDRILAERGHLDTALGETGYAFARLGDPELLIDHRREEGDLALAVTPGGKYRFGGVTSSRPRFLSSKHLGDIARFDLGDPYKRSEVDDLRRAILATGLVSSVTVTPRETRAPLGDVPGEVALDVDIAKAPLKTIAGAVGYESGEGPRAEVSWEHRNLLPPEGMLRLRAVGGLHEQLAGVTFRRNNFRGRDRVLTFDLYADSVQRTAYNARTLAFSGTFERLTTLLFQKPWTWSVGVELVASNEREGAAGNVLPGRSMYYTAALPLRAAWDGSDDLLDPRKGLRASLRVSPEISREGRQTVTYARIQADASWYQPVGQSVVLAARARVGSIPGAPLSQIAPSRRFYAGGGGSVRGYGYQQIGPRDTVGDPSGGRSLTELSLEARFETGLFDGALALAPFIDAGAVDDSTTPRLRDVRYGAGIGVRYKTGFGPIRIDLGTPLGRRKGESRIGVYVALGQAF